MDYHKNDMPMVEEHLERMKEKCKQEWFATAEGMKYKQRYDELIRELGALHEDMDKRLYAMMQNRYPM